MTSPHVKESDSGTRENQESWALESGIQLKASGIPLIIEVQNLSSNEKDCNHVPGIRNSRRGIWNPKTIFSISNSFPWGDMTGWERGIMKKRLALTKRSKRQLFNPPSMANLLYQRSRQIQYFIYAAAGLLKKRKWKHPYVSYFLGKTKIMRYKNNIMRIRTEMLRFRTKKTKIRK